MSKIIPRLVIIWYLASIIVLFFYSFTQIDLGLALTRYPDLYKIQQSFQEIGYFNRPLATNIYMGIIISLSLAYFAILALVKNKVFKSSVIWKLTLLTGLILLFSYNAFSYDFFNYIFDAKIVTHYGQNPYQHKALDFPGDPMLGFMHWTHRIYPYGPLWLVLTIPLSFMGSNIFIITYFLFKLLAVVSYLITVYFIGKIVERIFPSSELLAVSFFAFNPLVIIESLVSAHNDIVMMCFSIISLYFLIKKKYLYALIFLVISIGVKFATIFLFPVFLAVVTMQMLKEKINWFYFIVAMIICMLLAVLAATQTSGNFQPWYLLFFLLFAALIIDKFYIFIPSIILSISVLLVYIPYLYYGNWDPPVPQILLNIYSGSIIISLILPILYFIFRNKLSLNFIKSNKK